MKCASGQPGKIRADPCGSNHNPCNQIIMKQEENDHEPCNQIIMKQKETTMRREVKQELTEYILRYESPGLSEIPCHILRSKRKSYGISIDEEGQVVLRIPLQGSVKEACRLAEEKKDWIREKVYLQKNRLTQRRQREEESRQKYTKEQREGLERRYRQAAKEYIPRRVAYYAGILGVTYEKIRIAEQKTRWGSCSSRGTLSFNWKLMLAPPVVLDYVVVHELCHRKEMNHSKRFWALVEQTMPGYKEHRKWLKENGNTLQL